MTISNNNRIKTQTSIELGHDHVYIIGKNKTKTAKYYDDIDQSNGSKHHHPITYNKNGEPTIGFSDGHDHLI